MCTLLFSRIVYACRNGTLLKLFCRFPSTVSRASDDHLQRGSAHQILIFNFRPLAEQSSSLCWWMLWTFNLEEWQGVQRVVRGARPAQELWVMEEWVTGEAIVLTDMMAKWEFP